MKNKFLHHKPVATDRERYQRGRKRETIIKGVGTNPFDFKRPSREREGRERRKSKPFLKGVDQLILSSMMLNEALYHVCT